MKTIFTNSVISIAISFVAATIVVGFISRSLYQSHELVSEKFKTEITFDKERVIIRVDTDQVQDCDELVDLLGIQPIELSNAIYIPQCIRDEEHSFLIEYTRGTEV